ncbi:MAG: glycosyltransferase family 4 protein [Patescibacteria group bacterium]|nr:glycosyltransferase family 4 protein [Patescibacteria group bacterium]
MRIGIISQAYFPIHGGVTEHVHHTALELKKRGHDVTIITANFGREDRLYDSPLVRRIGFDLTVPSNGAFGNVTIGWRLAQQLRAIEREKKFDIVHIHSPVDPVLPLVAAKVIRAPKVGTFHSYMKSSNGFNFFQRLLEGYFKKLNGRIAVSQDAKTFFSKYFPGDYRIIPNGVDTERFSPAVKPLEEFRNGFFNILFVGRMDPRKGLKHLIKAMPLIIAAVPKTRLIVVGGGILQEYYRTQISENIIDRIHFAGFVSAEDLPRYYRTADVFCSPATEGESFGIVLIEALASGVPVVASDIEGYNSVVKNGRTGFLIPIKQPIKIAEKVIELLKQKKLRTQMGRQGRAEALRYSWPKVTLEIEKYYKEVLNKVKKSRLIKAK